MLRIVRLIHQLVGFLLLHRCVQNILHIPDYEIDRELRSGIVIDYYTEGMWWAIKDARFSAEQVSAMFSLLYLLLNKAKGLLPFSIHQNKNKTNTTIQTTRPLDLRARSAFTHLGL